MSFEESSRTCPRADCRHIVKGDSELIDNLRKRRFWRGCAYFTFLVSGLFALVDPSSLVVEQLASSATLWALAMAVAAAGCLFSAITDKWIGEYANLPLLVTVFWVYGGSALDSDNGESAPIIVTFGFLMIGMGLFLVARWVEVGRIRKNSFISDGQGG